MSMDRPPSRRRWLMLLSGLGLGLLALPSRLRAAPPAAAPPRPDAGADPDRPARRHFEFNDVFERMLSRRGRYEEFIREPSLAAGVYFLPAGSRDRQTPHDRDEVYYVVSGRAVLTVEGESKPVWPGTVEFVRAGAAHRFEKIEEDLKLLVLFAGARTKESLPPDQ